ncbi:MAG: transketolase family protein [Oscillospiraceae bacterium]|nr:transketolase family protein [Oscillospiraceae bacterium]
MVNIKTKLDHEPMMMREVLCEVLKDLADRNEKIVVLDSDLAASSGITPFAKAHPGRFINCGIAEANMAGVSAGLSAVGMVPFAHSFGCFASRKTCDQVFLSGCYAKLNLRIIGTDPGVLASYNGGTHMPFEDMSVLRGLAGITLVEPSDSVMLKALINDLADLYGVYYIRLQRKNAFGIYQEGTKFEIGRGMTLREGKDVTLIASGIMVAQALIAADLLQDQGLSARVVDLFTWKPADKDMIVSCAKETGAIVTCENHNIFGGLGSAVCEVLAQHTPVPVEMVGIHDEFGQVGSEDYLRGRYRLNAVDIAAAAIRANGRRSN